jgi:hypothetical protein
MPEQPDLQHNERRINRQIEKIRALEAAGRFSDAERARELLAVMTETRDALRRGQQVARNVMATQQRWMGLARRLPPSAD